jgi:hypothetical protein
MSPPPRIPGAYIEDKENAAPIEYGVSDNIYDKKKVTLGLAIAGVSPQPASTSAFEPGVTTSKLKRKSKNASSTPSPLFSSPNPALEAASAPKGSWFTNLFSWKTPVVSHFNP